LINKGKSRSNGGDLGAYLGDYLKSKSKNERVEVLEIRGSAFPDLHRSLASWEAEAQGSKCKKALWHAQLSPAHTDNLTRAQQLEAVDILEKHHGFQGQPRAVVVHQKEGHEHVHVTWSRMRRETITLTMPDGQTVTQKAGRAIRDSFSHKKNVAAAREIEERFDLRRVKSPEFDTSAPRQERREQSKKAPTYRDFQKASRSGIDPRHRKEQITALWNNHKDAQTFRDRLQEAGYILARGSKRDYVVVDKVGDVHSLPKQIDNANTADVRARFSSVDPSSIPHVNHVLQDHRHAFAEYQTRMRGSSGPETEQPDQQATPSPGGMAATENGRPTHKERKRKELPSLDPADILHCLTLQQSTFVQHDLQREIKDRLETRGEPCELRNILKIEMQVRKEHDFISLGKDRVNRPRYTTRALLETELDMRNASDRMVARRFHPVKDRPPLEQQASPLQLGEDQKKGLAHITGPEGLAILTGLAGTGKSTLLNEAHQKWVADGYRVRGTAVAGIAADGLQKGSQIKSRTLASTLFLLDNVAVLEGKLAEKDQLLQGIKVRGDRARKFKADVQTQRDKLAARIGGIKLNPMDVIVVDEAGMVGSRDMSRLLTHADKAGAKVVLVGDAEQLQAIDAGGPFRALAERHGSVRVSEVRRQMAEWQKQATRDFGDGFTSEALDAYRQAGHVKEFKEHDAARKQVITDWTSSRQTNPGQTHLMLAFTNADVTALNQAARDIYRKEGRLGKDETVKTAEGEKQFAAGDRLYFREANKNLGVMNGTLGTVSEVSRVWDSDHYRMTVSLDSGATVRFTTDEYGKFTHGFAGTMHRSQGSTSDRAHVLASKHMDRHAAYVAMTRHVKQVDMYYGADEFKNYDGLVYNLSRDRRKDTTLDYLRRAEEQGRGESWLQKLTGAIKREVKPQQAAPEKSKKSPAKTLFDLFLIETSKTPEQKREERQAKLDAAKLRGILERKDPHRSTGYSW
jgi:nucleoside-triphosphatase THEP1